MLSACLELRPNVDDVLLESDDVLVEMVNVGGCAQTGLAPGLLAERLGKSPDQMLDASGEPDGTFWAASRSACNDARLTTGPMPRALAGWASAECTSSRRSRRR